jgi:hypothetical protein
VVKEETVIPIREGLAQTEALLEEEVVERIVMAVAVAVDTQKRFSPHKNLLEKHRSK